MRLSAVVATGVSFRYGETVALAESSFTIPEGAVTTLIGPNGSGKSTLLHAIAGLITPVAGSIDVVGDRKIAYVLQATKVNEALPVTVREVVTMGRYATVGAHRRLTHADRAAVDSAIERMGIADLANRHLRELSGGQRQRVFVAQGIAQEHDLLLLDEPLTGLDLVSAKAIDDVLHEEQASGRTVVLTSHDLNEAAAGIGRSCWPGAWLRSGLRQWCSPPTTSPLPTARSCCTRAVASSWRIRRIVPFPVGMSTASAPAMFPKKSFRFATERLRRVRA